MIVDTSLLKDAARRNLWSTVTQDGNALVFTDRRHPGRLRMEPDGDSAVLVSVDIVDENALAAAFPGWPLDGATLHLPVDPPKGDDFLDFLPDVLDSLAKLASGPTPQSLSSPPAPVAAFATDREQVILARNGQGLYRDRLLAAWGGACAVTGLSEPDFLMASHAKPWKDASDAERLDGANGLPLIPNLDKLFDKGWISFANDGVILVSPSLSSAAQAALGVNSSLQLRLPLSDTQKEYLRYHREKVFGAKLAVAQPAPQPATQFMPAATPTPASPVAPALAPQAQDPWDDLLTQFPKGDEFRPFAEKARAADIAVPEAWIDLPDGKGGTVATAILAWPSEKVALVRDEDVADCAPLCKQGWQIVSTADSSAFSSLVTLTPPTTTP